MPYKAQNFCDKNVDPFDKELLTLMTECAANDHAEFTRDLFGRPLSPPRGSKHAQTSEEAAPTTPHASGAPNHTHAHTRI